MIPSLLTMSENNNIILKIFKFSNVWFKGVEEHDNCQRNERNTKLQADACTRAQAEAQRKKAEDLNRLNLSDDLVYPVDDYFQLSSSIPHFFYAHSPSFGAQSQSVTLNMNNLTNSPHLTLKRIRIENTRKYVAIPSFKFGYDIIDSLCKYMSSWNIFSIIRCIRHESSVTLLNFD